MTAPPPRHADLVAEATVGTAHRAVDLAALPEPLRPRPVTAEPAVALLDATALFALARRTRPPTALAPPAPPPPVPERLPVVPGVVRQVLGRVADQPAILLEALTLIHRAGFRLPPDLVPGLLDHARPDVVAASRPVAGEIGRLLTASNPRWAAPTPPDPTDRTAWEQGTTAQRVAWLRALRRIDPPAARDMLADALSGEGAGTRAELLGVLADRLSAADQDVLLAAVADRSRAVVSAALDLLTRLPESPLRRDMAALAARHLTVRRRLRRTSINITEPAPAEFAPWPAPDARPWTVLLGRVDPARWPQVFGVDLLELVATGAEELHPLFPGFRRAALTFRHADLARTLVAGQLATTTDAKVAPTADAELWAVLNPADATTLLDRLLSVRPVRPDLVTAAVSDLGRPWPTALSRRFATWLPATGPAGVPAPRPLWDLWATAVALPDCRALAGFARGLAAAPTGDHAPALPARAGDAANLLTLRAVLYETLCIPGGIA